jgi:hypothetical protein
VDEKDESTHQQLLWRDETSDGGAVTEAALRATEACVDARTLKKDPDTLWKSKIRIDETVLPPLLRVFAFNCLPLLKEKLGEIKKNVKGVKEVICDEDKSVKQSKRMVAKISEIAGDELKAQADKNEKWQPVSASVRDVLRATFVCEEPKAMRSVYKALNEADRLQVRKLKNKVKTGKMSFNLHAVYEFQPVADRPFSILVEIQIHDAKIRKDSAAQHKFYEISRARGSEDLLKVTAGGDSGAKDLMTQKDMKAIAKRKS